MRPYYDDGKGIQIYCGDCKQVLPLLAPESIALIITSPPYNKASKITSLRGGKKLVWARGTYREWYQDNMPWDEYMANQIEILEMCARLLTKDGSLMYNHKPDHNNRKVNHPLDWLRKVKSLNLIQEIVWARPGGMAFNSGLFAPMHEMIYWMDRADGKARWPIKEAVIQGSVWYMKPDREMDAVPCAFPIELPKRCIYALSNQGDIILDPFMGSGTTCFAAQALNRKAIGIEMEERYVRIAVERLRQMPLTLSVRSDIHIEKQGTLICGGNSDAKQSKTSRQES